MLKFVNHFQLRVLTLTFVENQINQIMENPIDTLVTITRISADNAKLALLLVEMSDALIDARAVFERIESNEENYIFGLLGASIKTRNSISSYKNYLNGK